MNNLCQGRSTIKEDSPLRTPGLGCNLVHNLPWAEVWGGCGRDMELSDLAVPSSLWQALGKRNQHVVLNVQRSSRKQSKIFHSAEKNLAGKD